jgi:hypothetical protein
MKNKFFKKIFLGLVLIMLLGILSVGCGGTVVPPPPPPPATCSITVLSQCGGCWGYVWVNGLSTGVWISLNGAASITGLTPGTVASVAIHDDFGWVSHTETIILAPGINIVTFTWF